MSKLHIDLETRSELNLKEVGQDVYAHHPSTRILMAAYAFDDAPVKLWQPHLEPMPEDFKAALTDPAIVKTSWNVGFEHTIISIIYDMELKIQEWYDPMAHARFLGFPGNLDAAGDVLNIETEHMKSSSGKKLIKLFSELVKAKKPTKKNPAGVPAHFKDWESHPEEWKQFCDYCCQDVVAERAIGNALDELKPFPKAEQNVWVKDQIINQRGVPICLPFVAKALERVEVERKVILGKMGEISGCENPNSPAQQKTWLETKGIRCSSLDKEVVAELLKEKERFDPDAVAFLEWKQLLGGIAFKKLPVFQDRTYNDRMRGAFVYHSAHTGRWSSRGVQLHNLLRPSKRVAENYFDIIKAIEEDLEMPKGIPVVEAISGTMRASIRAPEGKTFYVADFSSVENRVLAWLAKCPGMLNVFAAGLDPYKSFASDFYKLAYDVVTKEQRNFCKSPVLGCGFGMGHKRLVDYAAGMGQIISEEQAKELVTAWRTAYPEVVEYWKALGDACMQAVRYRQHLQLGPLRLDGRNPDMFFMQLPNGRTLNYAKPFIGRDAYDKKTLKYYGMNKVWGVIEARGSSLVENAVQAIARDLLVNGMRNVENAGFIIVLHVHDELVAEVPIASELTYEHFEKLLVTNPSWALDLPLKAEGFSGPIYKK